MPKRGAIALSLTTLALVLLFSFKTPDAQFTTGRNAAIVASSGTAPTAPAGAAAAPLSAPGPASNSNANANTGSGATAAPSPSAAPAAGSGGTALKSGTVTGQVVQTPYGSVQVQVTISSGKITDVTALQLPNDRQRSAEISQIAEPMLKSEALAAQSAQIDLISGATYTSDGYAQSLQSALDQAAHG